jgi:hypothetical protein
MSHRINIDRIKAVSRALLQLGIPIAFGRVWIQFNPDAGPSFISETYTLSGINKTHEGWTSTHNVMNPMGSDIQSVVVSGSLDKLK